jgi:hypothetical protein
MYGAGRDGCAPELCLPVTDYINYQRHPMKIKKPVTPEGVEGDGNTGFF